METEPSIHALVPDGVPPGTQVGPWRVLGFRGRGAYGAVYRVERVGQEDGGYFALKLALRPVDPRFAREVELLSRIHHPNVPCLYDHGLWEHPAGPYPYLVLEWVEGVPLYELGLGRKLSSRGVMRVLAQVARALAATHEVGGRHRDVKGENVLVRLTDRRALLIDFGVGDFVGARTLTKETLPPGTPPYRSPEALRYQWLHWRERGARYEPGPADDVYALGVTAWRLVTGLYPPPALDVKGGAKGRRFFRPPRVQLMKLVTVHPKLARLIDQMLSREPAARGSAAELAEALEHAEETADLEADTQISWHPVQESAVRKRCTALLRRARAWAPWLVAAASIALALGTWWSQHRLPEESPTEEAQASGSRGEGDRDPAGLADTVRSGPLSAAQPAPVQGGIGLVMPKEPLPGQARPPCMKHEVEINGGCWFEVKPPCGARAYEWKGKCLSPVPAPPRPATSDPP
jgi:eukaryotic-like serine/threonine-protein kinase